MLAAGVTLSSSDRVLTTLVESETRNLGVGQALVEVLPFQDLFLAPLLAIPTALHTKLSDTDGNSLRLLKVVVLDMCYVTVIVVISRTLLPFFIKRVIRNGEQGRESGTQYQYPSTPNTHPSAHHLPTDPALPVHPLQCGGTTWSS